MSVGALHDNVIWHDVECGAYGDDLPLWEQLAREARGRVLELGCGSGRVALRLARRGSVVTGIDIDAALVAELRRRAGRERLEVTAFEADAAAFCIDRRFELVIAAMQLLQLLPGAGARRDCLAAIAAHLAPGGIAALAIVEGSRTGAPASPPLPDAQEVDGWVYSSLPLGVGRDGDAMLIERLRQTVDPDGRLRETMHRTRLEVLTAEGLEAEAQGAGLRPAGRREIHAGEHHVGSTVVLLEA